MVSSRQRLAAVLAAVVAAGVLVATQTRLSEFPGLVRVRDRLEVAGGYGNTTCTIPRLCLGGNGSSPNAGQLVFGDGTGWRTTAGPVVAGVYTPVLTIEDRGMVQAPKQPGFLAYQSASTNPAAGSNTIPVDVEVYDTLGNFGGSTFTAPITGVYLLCLAAKVSATSIDLQIVTSNRTYVVVSGSSTVQDGGCVFADMDVNDQAYGLAATSGSTTIQGSGTPYVTYFSGRLVP